MRIALLALAALLLVPHAIVAQPALPRVAIIYSGTPESDNKLREAFEQAMLSRGYAVGKTMVLESVFIEGRKEVLAQAVREVVARKPAVIVVHGSILTNVAKAATSSIPIVMASVGDPVGQGLVASLARPGANITGNASLSQVLGAKRLEILKELFPKIKQVGYIVNVANPGYAVVMKYLDASAANLGFRLVRFKATNEAELEGALSAVAAARVDAVLMTSDLMGNVHRRKINDSLARTRTPAIHSYTEAVLDGGLISYSTNRPDAFRNAASFVDRILKGANSGDLPIEQPTKFELVVNLKTAKALGITIPQSILLRADRVIE